VTIAPLLGDSDLADADDLVRFTPTGLSLEELSKLWSVFLQTPYVLSIAYQAGPVLVEQEVAAAATALPVLFTPRVHGVPTGSPAWPGITQVLAQATAGATPAAQPILAGYTLVLDGSFAAGVATRVLIDGNLAASLTSTGGPISLVLAPALALRSGPHEVQVVQDLPTGQTKVPIQSMTSNTATFALQPTINTVTGSATSVSVSLTPEVGQLQSVTLLLNQLNPPAGQTPASYSFTAPLPTVDNVDPFPIPISGVTTGLTYLVRVQVDGAESVLAFTTGTGFTGPTVSL
jgi:hypothetical protein